MMYIYHNNKRDHEHNRHNHERLSTIIPDHHHPPGLLSTIQISVDVGFTYIYIHIERERER